MIVTDIIWIDDGGQKHRGFSMDGYLAENLAGIPSHQKKDWDVIGVVSGSGKVRAAKCLEKETKVKILNKKKEIVDSKPLKEYKDGEILNTISWDFNKGKQVKSKSQVIKNKDKRRLYLIELENGKIIKCSMDHKLFIKRKFKNNIVE